MKRRYKNYFKLNLMSIFLIAVSFISVTLAWFAYSGLSKVSTEVNVKAWYIELEKNGEKVSNDIVISLSEIYPGMDIVDEIIKIKNLGDSDAEVNYSIVSARILDENNYEVDGDTITSEYVEDLLSHKYPFGININLSKKYALSKGDESVFEVSVSWPLDSDNDIFDSEWGTKAYNFQMSEENKKNADSSYQIRPSIQIVISLTAEQYMVTDTSSDIKYDLGDEILFDVENNRICSIISSPSCLKTYVLDVNNRLGDETVTLLPNPFSQYLNGSFTQYDDLFLNITNEWAVETRPLLVEDVMNIISTDVIKSSLIRNNISDSIIGDLKYNNRMNIELTKAINYNGYYRFSNDRFGFLSSSECYWTQSEYNSSRGFALKRIDESNSKVYGEEKETVCKVIPVLVVPKSNL